VIKPDINRESRLLATPAAFDVLVGVGGVPSVGYIALRYGKTRMVWLPDGEKIVKICLFILTEYTNVTDGWTDGRTNGQTDPNRATA